MNGREQGTRGSFGFARRPEVDQPAAASIVDPAPAHPTPINPEPVNPSYAEEWETAPSQHDAGGREPPPMPSTSEADHWVVRAKTAGLPEETVEADPGGVDSTFSSPFAGEDAEPRSDHRRDHRKPKRWLALGLAFTVYATGIAGLWSMVSSFDGMTAPTLSPAGNKGTKTLPPVERVIDLRDARLDGPIIPRLRPDGLIAPNDELATSEFQKKI